MGISDHLTCLLRNLYAGHSYNWSHNNRLVPNWEKSVYCHPVYLTYMQSTSCKMLDWMKHKLESRLQGKYQEPQICRWHHPYGRKWRGTKKPLDEDEEEREKIGLKLNIQKTKIMASGSITSWQIEGETVETVTDSIFRGLWTWVWASFRSWWWTGKPGLLQSMGSHSWTQQSDWTELNWEALY